MSAAGFSPPAVPKDRLGPCAAGLFGGWAEVQLRGRLPTVHVDYRREYQMVFLLQKLQDLLAAEHLLAAPRPEIGIPETWSIAEGVAKCLTKWSALGAFSPRRQSRVLLAVRIVCLAVPEPSTWAALKFDLRYPAGIVQISSQSLNAFDPFSTARYARAGR